MHPWTATTHTFALVVSIGVVNIINYWWSLAQVEIVDNSNANVVRQAQNVEERKQPSRRTFWNELWKVETKVKAVHKLHFTTPSALWQVGDKHLITRRPGHQPTPSAP